MNNKMKIVSVLGTLTLMVHLCSMAQDRSRSIIYQADGLYVEANVLPKVSATSGDKNLTYFWFRSNQINSTVGAYDSNLLHGKYASYYRSKNLKELGAFDKGLKTGIWESWYESGMRDEVIVLKHGKRNGAYKKCNSDGQLILSGTYKNGLLHGYLITYHSGKELLKRKYRNGEEIIEEPPSENVMPAKKGLRWFWPFKKDKAPEPGPIIESPEDDDPQKT